MSLGRPFRRRLSASQAALLDHLGPIDGATVPGGCDRCHAEQTATPSRPGVWLVTVLHEPTCPTLAAHVTTH